MEILASQQNRRRCCKYILIVDTEQVFTQEWQNNIGVGMTDTGNAMKWHDVDRFDAVIGSEKRMRVLNQGVIINDPESLWLSDYWKEKTIVGLLLMPITRHQIVHIHDSFKIKQKYGTIFMHKTRNNHRLQQV